MKQPNSVGSEVKPACPECDNWSDLVERDDQRYCKTCGMVRKRLEVPERLNVGGNGFSGYKVRDYDYSKKVSPKSANEGGCAFTVLMIGATAAGVFLWV